MIEFFKSNLQAGGVSIGVLVLTWALGKYLPKKKIDESLRAVDSFLGNVVTMITDKLIGGACYALGRKLSAAILSVMRRKDAERFEEGALVTLATWLESLMLIVARRVAELAGVFPLCFRRIKQGMLSDNERRKNEN